VILLASGCLFDVSNPYFDGLGASESGAAAEEACSLGLVHRNDAVYASIQEAVDVAVEGDVIEVCPGEYRENLELYEHITIRRMPGSEGQVLLVGTRKNTVIWASEGGVFEGLVLSGGQGWKASNGSRYGGGLYAGIEATIDVIDVTFLDNSAEYGGGFYGPQNGESTLTGCVFEGNRADVIGGGAAIGYGSSELNDVTFRANRSKWGGGLSLTAESTAHVDGVVFDGNAADSTGGAMYIGSSVVLVSGGEFSGSFPKDILLAYDGDSLQLDAPGAEFTCDARHANMGCE